MQTLAANAPTEMSVQLGHLANPTEAIISHKGVELYLNLWQRSNKTLVDRFGSHRLRVKERGKLLGAGRVWRVSLSSAPLYVYSTL